MWQNWAYQTLVSLGTRATQGPGALHLFGFPSASGVKHEIDAAGMGDVALVIEAKDHQYGISKEHIDIFHGRTLDYFEGAVQRGFAWDFLSNDVECQNNRPPAPEIRCSARHYAGRVREGSHSSVAGSCGFVERHRVA